MVRFEESVNLFGSDGGAIGTIGNISCQWCGTDYTGRETADGEGRSGNESILFTNFGDLQVCRCCYGGVEQAVLGRMDDIIPWFTRILRRRREILEGHEQMLADLRQALATTAATVH